MCETTEGICSKQAIPFLVRKEKVISAPCPPVCEEKEK